jgi:DNA-binding beta-propeller fold protein YncE
MKRIFLLTAAAFCFAGPASAETLIVGNKGEHTVSFIDLETAKEVARPKTGRSPHEIAVSPDGATAVVVSYRAPGYTGNSLHIFDVATATKVKEISLGDHRGPHGLKWIPGTTHVIATTEVSQDVVIADIEAGTVVGSIKTNQQGSHMVALSPDATRAYVANIGSGSFTVMNLDTMTKIRDIKAGNGTEAITVSSDGSEIWVGNNGSRSVMIFDTTRYEKIDEFSTDGVPIRVEFNHAGDVVAVSEADLHRVAIYDAKTRERLALIDLTEADAQVPVTMMFSPDGDKLWVATTASQKVVEIDTSDWSIIRTLSAGQGSDGLGYSPLTVAAPEIRRTQ